METKQQDFEVKATKILRRIGKALEEGRGVRLSFEELKLITLGELGCAVEEAMDNSNQTT